jgi:hypothetical protein
MMRPPVSQCARSAQSAPCARASPSAGYCGIARDQPAAAAFDDVRQRLDDARVEREAAVFGAIERCSEAQPFAAVIIAVLEEMLDRPHAKLRADARRGEGKDDGDNRRGQHADLRAFAEIAAETAH